MLSFFGILIIADGFDWLAILLFGSFELDNWSSYWHCNVNESRDYYELMKIIFIKDVNKFSKVLNCRCKLTCIFFSDSVFTRPYSRTLVYGQLFISLHELRYQKFFLPSTCSYYYWFQILTTLHFLSSITLSWFFTPVVICKKFYNVEKHGCRK